MGVNLVENHNLDKAPQNLYPLFYQTSKRLRKSSRNIRRLKKFLFTEFYKKESVAESKLVDQELSQMEKMLSKLQVINGVMSNQEEPKEKKLECIINTILNKLQLAIIERNIFVRIYAEDDISFFSKPNLLYVILENLIENAVYYSSKGSSQSYIEINLKKLSNELVIGIEDNGIGIRQEAFDKIFNIFYKDSDQSNGGGLGLYIVREALQKLDGKIDFKSQEGCFTKIEVHIPESVTLPNVLKHANTTFQE